MKRTRYFVKDINDVTRPVMGTVGIYCTTPEMCKAYGMDRDEAQHMCDILNNGEEAYENSEYEVIALTVDETDERDKTAAALAAYIAEHYRPDAPADAAEQMRLFEEAEQGLTPVSFEDFKKEAEQYGGFDPEDKDWHEKVVAEWALGQIPVIWAYCREWSDGAVVFTDVEPYYSGIDNTCEILSKSFVDFGEHCARVNFY